MGSALDDRITGGDGNDAIEGGEGADAIDGGAGDDTLFGQEDRLSFTGDAADAMGRTRDGHGDLPPDQPAAR